MSLLTARTAAARLGIPSRAVPIGATTDPTRDGTVYVTAGGGGRELYGFGPGVPDSYEGHVRDRDEIRTFRWTASRVPDPETVAWSRVRYTGFSFIAVGAEPGPSPKLTVTALAGSGERVDTFDVVRGRAR